MPNMDSMANGGVESSAESHEAEEQHAVPKSSPAATVTKGRELRRCRRIRREQQRDGYTTAPPAGDGGVSGSRGDADSAQLHKRRVPLPADAPKVKHVEAGPAEDESSTASVESRFIPQPPKKLDSGLEGLLVASAGFSIGADSDHSEDRSSSRSSTAASAQRAFARHGHHASPHGKHPRAARSRADRLRVHAPAGSVEAEDSRSSVDSDRQSSNSNGRKASHLSVGILGNGDGKSFSASGGHSDEGQPGKDARSTASRGYDKENGSSVVGKLALVSSDSDSDDGVGHTLHEESARNGGLHSAADPYAESVLLLQRTQEALEKEIGKFVAVDAVPSDEFDIYDDEGCDSVHLEEPIEEVSQRIKHLESRLEEASTLIKEKDSRILELEALVRLQPGKTATENTNLLLSQFELEGLYQEKMEAEIQCLILTGAYQTLRTLSDDQMAIYVAQKSLSEDYKELGLKLRHAEIRAMTLEEKAEKLQVQCKELYRSSEVLQLQSKASRVSFFCLVQFILLCIAIGTYLMQFVPSSSIEVVPT